MPAAPTACGGTGTTTTAPTTGPTRPPTTGPTRPPTTVLPGPNVCNGIGFPYDPYFRECCSSSKPCGLNEGDCDKDSECSGSLVCGKNNCPSPFPSNADCCEAGPEVCNGIGFDYNQ